MTGNHVAKVKTPQFIMVGEGRNQKEQLAKPQWNDAWVAEYLLDNSKRLVTVGELATRFYGKNKEKNRKDVRKYLSKARRYLLNVKHALLVYEFDKRLIGSVKVFDPASEQDRQLIKPYLERIAKRRELTESELEIAQDIVQGAPAPPPPIDEDCGG